MTITTQDCKDFILSISQTINAPKDDTWKRLKKYKEGSLVLRNFENQDGRQLTIAEQQATLFLYSLSAPTVISVSPTLNTKYSHLGYKNIGKDISDTDIFEFMAQCVKENTSIVYDYKDTIKDAINSKSWTIWERWTDKTTHKSYDVSPLNYFFKNSGHWGEFDLFYPNKNEKESRINPQDILQVFWVGMEDYDTTYRIYIFETKNHELLLGSNNPD